MTALGSTRVGGHRNLTRIIALSIFPLCLTLAQARPDAQPPNGQIARQQRVGINSHMPGSKDFSAMEAAGFRWARVDMTWDAIEPEPGSYNWGATDAAALLAKSAGIRLVGILGYCPGWASSGPTKFYPPKSASLWSEYVAAVVGRYCDSVYAWILWNEPNCDTYFRGTPEEYIELVLLPGSSSAKEADPSCLIAGPDLAHRTSCHWEPWLETVLRRAGDRFDIISHHCYQQRLDEVFRNLDGSKWPWEPPAVRKIVEECGQGHKPFWLTESGWNSQRVGEEVQAKNLLGLIEGCRSRSWIERVFIYELNDSLVEPGFGILRVDGSPKSAFQAVKAFLAKEAK